LTYEPNKLRKGKMRKVIEYLGVLSAFLVLGASMAFAEWIAQFEIFGWFAVTFICFAPIYLAIKFWRSI
jgi:hypothetical protein